MSSAAKELIITTVMMIMNISWFPLLDQNHTSLVLAVDALGSEKQPSLYIAVYIIINVKCNSMVCFKVSIHFMNLTSGSKVCERNGQKWQVQ